HLVLQGVRNLRDALAHLAMDGHVIDRRVTRLSQHDCRQPQQLEVPAKGAPHAVLELCRLDRRKKADFTEVHGEDRHARARVALQSAQDRSVSTQHHAQLHLLLQRHSQLHALDSLQRVLARLVLVEAQAHPRRRRQLGEAAQGRRGLLAPAVREHRELPHRSASRTIRCSCSCARASNPPATPAARRRGPASRRAGSHSQMNVSRLPFGPGRPEGWKPSTAAPSCSAACATPSSAARRAPASRTTPPLPTRPRPSSNWGFTSASTSWRSPMHASTAPRTLAREMNETSTTATSGLNGSISG